MTARITGLDSALALDAICYSHPIPQNYAVLTVMGAVFDRVYFPGVYMPKGGYDERELQKEIDARTLIKGRPDLLVDRDRNGNFKHGLWTRESLAIVIA